MKILKPELNEYSRRIRFYISYTHEHNMDVDKWKYAEGRNTLRTFM